MKFVLTDRQVEQLELMLERMGCFAPRTEQKQQKRTCLWMGKLRTVESLPWLNRLCNGCDSTMGDG
jgi:hypothetical protein